MSSDTDTDNIDVHGRPTSLDTQKQKRQDLSSAATDTFMSHDKPEVGVGAGGSKAKQEVDVD